MYLTTNGFYLDKEMAKKLADYKASRVSVSIDSMDEKIHDEIRGRKESWKRAIEALEHVKNAGMDPYLNITVGHYNAKSEDVKLLLSQSERCRDILADIAAEPEELGNMPFEDLPLSVFLQDVVDNTASGRVNVRVETDKAADQDEPHFGRRPEIMRGLGNLIQNAEQFARHRVVISATWEANNVQLQIRDDGPGFSAGVLAAIGEPYISTRTEHGDHMGLGIFIAQSLLERSGAALSFRNRGGGEVAISWPRSMLELASDKPKMGFKVSEERRRS